MSDECVSTKLGVTENFVSSLYLFIQSSTLKECIEHCLTALGIIYIYIFWNLLVVARLVSIRKKKYFAAIMKEVYTAVASSLR